MLFFYEFFEHIFMEKNGGQKGPHVLGYSGTNTGSSKMDYKVYIF